VKRSAMWMILLPLALAGCGGLFQTKAPPPAIYQLSAASRAVSATAPVAPAPGAAELAVLKPRVRAGLDTDRIAALYADRRLEYFADARWSGTLDVVIQDLAVQEFRLTADLRGVSADASVFPSPYWLEIEVTDFQAEYSASAAAPTVHVHFLARIGDSADRRILAQLEAGAEEAASENRLSAIVSAYNRAADRALAEIAAGTALALNEAGKGSRR
jgi:cholesterol transport system auxiliary component